MSTGQAVVPAAPSLPGLEVDNGRDHRAADDPRELVPVEERKAEQVRFCPGIQRRERQAEGWQYQEPVPGGTGASGAGRHGLNCRGSHSHLNESALERGGNIPETWHPKNQRTSERSGRAGRWR